MDYFTQLRASSRTTSLTPLRDRLVDTAAGDCDQLRGYAAAFLIGRRPAKATIDRAKPPRPTPPAPQPTPALMAHPHLRRPSHHPPRPHPAPHHPARVTLQIRLTALTLAAVAATGPWVLIFHATTG